MGVDPAARGGDSQAFNEESRRADRQKESDNRVVDRACQGPKPGVSSPPQESDTETRDEKQSEDLEEERHHEVEVAMEDKVFHAQEAAAVVLNRNDTRAYE